MKVSKDIETKANQLLSSYFDAKGKSIKAPIDPIDILEYKGYSVDYVNGKYDLNIYGALQIERKTIEINDDVTFNDGMENFTIAHELGHIVLHASKDKNNNEIGCEFDSPQKDNLLEREADDFAAYAAAGVYGFGLGTSLFKPGADAGIVRAAAKACMAAISY